LRTVILSIALTIAFICSKANSAPPAPPEGYAWVANDKFTDEFNGAELDSSKWYDHHPRWRGRPPAKFMPESVSVKDGTLQLKNGMLAAPQGPFTIAGGAVVSKSTEAFYGYYEVSMKASKISMSSTFWFSNDSRRSDPLRSSLELDVQEAVGAGKRHPERKHFMKSNTHFWVREGRRRFSRSVPGETRISPPAGEAFHVYGVWWVDANTIKFYHNDEHKFTIFPSTEYDDTPFDRPMHMNLVTETYDWETPPTPEELADNSINTTYYDWVRSYVLVKKEEAE
jgi:beta-glucanase (GH16 family)